MNDCEIPSLYGLKYNPFLPDVPFEALFTMAAQGGFALIAGDP